MEFLTTLTQRSQAGYPLILFYVIALLGFVLILLSPQKAFLLALFCLSARNFHAAIFTRTALFGAYLNLNDLLLWIALSAMITQCLRENRKIWAPGILLAICGIVIIGDVQSVVKYGTSYNVLKRIWSTAIFPIMFLVGSNMVQKEKQAAEFYKVLFLGVVFASVQHMYFLVFQQSVIDEYDGYAQIRTISYIASGGASVLIGSVFAGRSLNLRHPTKALYYIGLALVGSSVLLSFTRGLWITVLGAVVVIPLLIKEDVLFKMSTKKLVIIVSLCVVILSLALPKLQLAKQITKRVASFAEPEAFRRSYHSRELGQKAEINLWLNGSIILGEGSVLTPEMMKETTFRGAYYHVAYSTYLAHYGLIGLIIYLIVLPLSTINIGRSYYSEHSETIGSTVALTGVTCAVMYMLGFMWSNSYIVATTHVYGLLYGAVWGLNRGSKMRRSVSSDPNRK